MGDNYVVYEMGITVCPKLYSYGYALANIKSRPEGRLKCSKSHYNYCYRREKDMGHLQ